MVALLGIVVNDAIVLVDFINNARKEGMPHPQNGNLANYQVATAAAPTLIGNDKLVYTYDETTRHWVSKDLVKKVTP